MDDLLDDDEDLEDPPLLEARNPKGHLEATQQYIVFGLALGPCYIYLARPQNDIFPHRVNNFYFKHVLHPSKKGRTAEEKNLRRFAKRNFTTKQKKEGKAPASSGIARKPATEGRLDWYAKYGAERLIEDNTVIRLGADMSFERLRVILFEHLADAKFPEYEKNKFGKMTVRIDFPTACVISVKAKPCNYMYVEVDKVIKDRSTYFDVYHFDYVAQGQHKD